MNDKIAFGLGCNYWASNAGTDMWRDWNEEVVKQDIKELAENGVKYLRVFPNWRDFQPVIPVYTGSGKLYDYYMEEDKLPENKYYISDEMLKRLGLLLDICLENHVLVIVGLLTGWMSGRLFIPSILYGKNLYKDSTALLFEQRLIAGIVTTFCNHEAILAWDLGNECNCMSNCETEEEALNWTAIITSTVKSHDQKHPVISGMHGLGVSNEKSSWTIRGQAEFVDIMTTHPYPLWVRHCGESKILTYRTTMHATAESRLYADISGKPCLVEEIGTMGPMICSEKVAAAFLKVNIWSNWANDTRGLLWWCAYDQIMLNTPPYNYQMCELELGMIDIDHAPKEQMQVMHEMNKTIANLPKLPQPLYDAVCILTEGQDQWGIAYMTYCAAKQAGMNIRFVYQNQELPNSQIYLMPSVNGYSVMRKDCYQRLRGKVEQGACLYVSISDGCLADFRELAGVKIIDSYIRKTTTEITFDRESILVNSGRSYLLKPESAKVLAYDGFENPSITVNEFGKGKVFFTNFAYENEILQNTELADNDNGILYRWLFSDNLNKRAVKSGNPMLAVTIHSITDDEKIIVAINHTNQRQPSMITTNCEWRIDEVLFGDINYVDPYDAMIFRLKNS